jgi:hypothetical protein
MIIITDKIVLINPVQEQDVLEGEVLAAEVGVFRDIKAGPQYIEELGITVLIDEDITITKALINIRLPLENNNDNY